MRILCIMLQKDKFEQLTDSTELKKLTLTRNTANATTRHRDLLMAPLEWVRNYDRTIWLLDCQQCW